MNSTATLYADMDGNDITVGNGSFTVCAYDGQTVSIAIGPVALAHMAHALLVHAAAIEAAQEESQHAGAAIGLDLVRDLSALSDDGNEKAFRCVRRALRKLTQREQHLDNAIDGFSMSIAGTLVRGIASYLVDE